MQISDFKNKKILVMGLGIHGGGLGVANFFLKTGAQVTITDLRGAKELAPSIEKLAGKSKLVLGRHDKEDFKSADLVIRNPAVPAQSEFLAVAKKNGVPVEMESSLFLLLSPTKKIIGVTGTKGKTTSALLISHFLKQARKKVLIGGNLRVSMLELLPKIKSDFWIVLELSSWQLEGLEPHRLSPYIAVLTNIYQDHLNRYLRFEDYVFAKKLIFKFQNSGDFLIINGNQPLTKKIAGEAKSQVRFFSIQNLPKEIITAFRLPGRHNLENLACSLEVAKVLEIDEKLLIKATSTFGPLADHLEEIGIIDGVKFVNDTTATIPDAAIAALSTFKSPVILVCGGTDKDLDFRKMTEIINQKVEKVALLEGTATEKIVRGLKTEKILGRFSNFYEAVKTAKLRAKSGDVVLLSPGCASFGMFANEFDRGEKFKKIVKELEKKD